MPFSANTNQSFFPSLLCLSINRAIYLSLTPELNRQVAKYWPPGSKLHPLFSQDFSKVFQSLFFPQKKLVPPRRTDETEENNTTRRRNDQLSTFSLCHSSFFLPPAYLPINSANFSARTNEVGRPASNLLRSGIGSCSSSSPGVSCSFHDRPILIAPETLLVTILLLLPLLLWLEGDKRDTTSDLYSPLVG